MSIKEKFVQDAIISWLEKKGYKMGKVTYQRFGIDIQARNYPGEYYLVECKGETKGENSYLDFSTGLGQLMLRMNKEVRQWRHYALGLPDTRHFLRHYDKFMKLPKQVRKLLKIRFLFVNNSGAVREIKSY